jgi:hypothetical protein
MPQVEEAALETFTDGRPTSIGIYDSTGEMPVMSVTGTP